MVGTRAFPSLILVLSLLVTPWAAAQATDSPTPSPLKAGFKLSFGDRQPCAGESVTATDTSSGEVAGRAWQLNDGPMNAYGAGPTITFTLASSGPYKLHLMIVDRSGSSRSEYSLSWTAVDCQGSPSPGSPSQSPQPSCYTYTYRDENGVERQGEKCYESSYPSPTATAAPAPDSCQALAGERQKYESDWNYRYYAHYKESGTEPGSDAAFDQEMRSQMDAWASNWKQRWISAGCDGASAECQRKIEAAKAEFEQLRQKYEPLWQDYFQRLENARREFSASGHHSDAEWREFETRWSSESQALSARFEQDAQAIYGRHPGLQECGFYYEYYHQVARTDYKETYPAPPPTAAPYDAERAECEAKMAQIKETYAARFEELYLRLRQAAPDSSDYASIKQQILALEDQVQAELQIVAEACRRDYQAVYTAPRNYRDGAGALTCFYEEGTKQIRCQGRYVSFQGNPQTQLLSAYTCGGQLYFDQIYANQVFQDFQFSSQDQEGRLAILSSQLKILLHDSPRGVINVGVVDEAEVYFVPNILFDVRLEGQKVILDGPHADGAFLGGADDLHWDAEKRVLSVRGEATWVAESCIPTGDKPDGAQDPAYWDAIQKRRLGAQVTVAVEAGAVEEKEEQYDDGMDVKVRREGTRNKFIATVDADEDCKTLVLKFNLGIFSTIRLRVLLTDENGNTLEIRKADNLEDVLEPCGADEANAFEYWTVVDELGTQVIVSFSHFSEKRVSVEAAATQDIGVPGFGVDLAILGAALAVASVAGIRRRLTR